MASVDIPIEKIDAVFIWAPTARCGVTLLQRLITSSREILVYGENLFFTNLIPQHIVEMSKHTAEGEAARARLNSGDCNFWSSAAFPHMELYRRHVTESFYSAVAVYQTSAVRDGYRSWGLKTPGTDPDGPANIIRQLLPASRHLYIYRHVEDVIASCKARRWIDTPAAAEQQAGVWCRNTLKILALEEDDRTLVLRYEDLVADQSEQTARLREFLGVSNLDVSVFEHKYNTFRGDEAAGHSPTQYVPPIPLTDEERVRVQRAAAPALEQAGYPMIQRDSSVT